MKIKHRNLVVTIAGFVAGVSLSSFVYLGWALALLFIFLGVIFLLLFRFNKQPVFIALCLLFVFAGLGQLRYAIADDNGKYGALEEKINQKIILEGIVFVEPEEKENYTRVVLKERADGSRILVYLQKYPKFKYGDKLKLTGILKKPKNFNSNDSKNLQSISYGGGGVNNGNFNWPDYLAKDGIYYEMFYPQADFISSGNGSWLKEKLFAAKKSFLSSVSLAVPEPQASFLGGITIGAKEGLPKDIQEKFRQTGVAHIVALSGYNITIVAETVMLILNFLPRYLAIVGGATGVILFAVMAGASATVLRASIMALLVLTAKATGRIYTVSWALFLAGFFMVLQNPKILRFDTSFQLSFLATLGLIYLSPFFEEKLKFVPQKFKLREIFSATVSAQIFVLPLLIFKTGEMSLVGLPVNFLILPFIPLTMFSGFATGILGVVSGLMSVPFGWASYALLQYELWVVEIFARLPFAEVRISGFSEIFLVVSYSAVFFGIYLYNKRKKSIDVECR